MKFRLLALSSALAAFAPNLVGCSVGTDAEDAVTENDDQAAQNSRRVILFVWDGLRPDSINKTDTPNLAAMRSSGSNFSDNHSTFPTFTMMNAASFATGAFPGTTGFYGNTFYQRGPTGHDATGKALDFNQPQFVEDYSILSAFDSFYQGQLLMVGTLFAQAQAAGLKTVAIGKSGAAFLQDYKRGGLILDEKMAYPLAFAEELKAAQYALPKLTPSAYDAGAIALAETNGDPTASAPKKTLADGTTGDPTDASGAPPNAANAYMMNVYLNYVLPQKSPELSVLWFRNPDSTQHTYGVGVPNSKDGLHAQDQLLGQLRQKLADLNLTASTDIIVASDHGHSNVAGDRKLFPLRAISAGAPGAVDKKGYSFSGDVRLADLLTRAGMAAFDGSGCVFNPGMVGLKADGSSVYPVKVDTDGTVCGTVGKKYNTPAYTVPATLPAKAIVIAANGGSDYLYVPSHDAGTVQRVVTFLQSRKEFGAVFVSSAYGDLPGTFPLDLINAGNDGRGPDVIVSYDFDADAVVQGVKGTEYESAFNSRGMHGSFSPFDVHNTLLASGPHFRKQFKDKLPTGNVDVAPTIAAILKLGPLSGADGRPLLEAMKYSGHTKEDYEVESASWSPTEDAFGLTVAGPTDPDGHDVDPHATSYTTTLHTKFLFGPDATYVYFDSAKATRH